MSWHLILNVVTKKKNLLSDWHTQTCLLAIDKCAKLACNLFDCGGKQSEANPNQQTMRLHQGYKRLKVNKRTVHPPQEGTYENASPCKWAEMKCAGRKGSDSTTNWNEGTLCVSMTTSVGNNDMIWAGLPMAEVAKFWPAEYLAYFLSSTTFLTVDSIATVLVVAFHLNLTVFRPPAARQSRIRSSGKKFSHPWPIVMGLSHWDETGDVKFPPSLIQ